MMNYETLPEEYIPGRCVATNEKLKVGRSCYYVLGDFVKHLADVRPYLLAEGLSSEEIDGYLTDYTIYPTVYPGE